jgi:3-hydroxyacyl-[acyl-carrier-protein] dehydratase
MMNNQEILKCHRLRYPYLFVDRIDEIVQGESVRGYKYFTENEWFFHCSSYEDQPVPFTVLMETLEEVMMVPILMAQENQGKTTNTLSLSDAKVFRQIYPGDTLVVEGKIESSRRGLITGISEGYVDGEPACMARFRFSIPEILEQFRPR